MNANMIQVSLGPRTYPIYVNESAEAFGSGFVSFVNDRLAATWAGKGCQKALVLTDTHVAEPWARLTSEQLQELGLAVNVLAVEAGEESKSLATLSQVYDSLIDLKADRHTLVVAVGGGVIGDLGGFAAASFNRGLPLVMVPTSLLAMVDSSVGGKTGVNHPRGKNLIGAFHQPVGVWISVQTLATLPEREFRSGLAEVVKYGVIQDPEFFAYLEQHAEAALARDPAVLAHLVRRSCRLKADVVEQDEFEQSGLRAILNFGHTVAHAIENIAGYGEFLHGEAVAVGMVAESLLAEKLGWIDAGPTHRLTALLSKLQLPVTLDLGQDEALLAAMRHDKKNVGGRVRFVLPRAIGSVAMTNLPDDPMILATLRSLKTI